MRLLLLDEGWGSTLLVARGLAQHGHAVTVLTPNGRTDTYRHADVVWGSLPRLDAASFDDALIRAVEIGRFDRVLPLTERWMTHLWCSHPSLSDRLFPATQPWQRSLLASKHRVLAHMKARGISVPAQAPLADAATLGLPIVIKGATGVAGTRVRIAETASERAGAIARATTLGGDWIAQEYIPGPTYLFGALAHEGRVLRSYLGEKVEQYPERTGPAIRMRSYDRADLVALGMRAIGELRWTGLASADLMRRADGSLVLLEINPRPWGSIAGANVAGVDLFGPLAALLDGHVPDTDLRFRADVECRIFPRYLLAANYRSVGGLRHALADLLGEQGRDWRDPAFAFRNLRRLHSLRGQWTTF